MNRWLASLITFIYPARCRSCETPMGVGQVHYICDECWKEIQFVEMPWCQICGAPLRFSVGAPAAQRVLMCADCRTRTPLYGKLRAIVFYESAVREAIHLLKYDRKQILAKHLIHLVQAHLPKDVSVADYDCVVPIPLHPRRYRSRGFNQAEQIAHGLAQTWNVPIRTDILFRIRNTVPQSSLNSHEEREKNIAGAFEVRSPTLVRDRKILVVDDIFTTGTTINEAVRVLQAEKPICVDVLTLARTRVSV